MNISVNAEERKNKLKSLLEKQKQKAIEDDKKPEISLLMEPFSNKSDLEVVDLEELLKVKEEFSQSFPVEFWASRIHWEKVDKKIELPVGDFNKIELILKDQGLLTDIPVYFFFSDNSYWLRTDMKNILKNLEDIAWYRGDRYVFSSNPKFVVEFFHDDLITIGWH